MKKVSFGEDFLSIAEIHYFRLSPQEWEDRILKAKNAGFKAISSYVPWLIHEEIKGKYDFSGPYDLGKFIDLVASHELYFIARPGPFVMAELKNEGIPYWVYDEKPHIIPISWNSKKVENAQVIYNHPDFLSEVDRWYAAVAEIIRPRLIQNGGNIIAIQIDNEIGMLHWVNNTPDLSDFTLSRFIDWLLDRFHDPFRYGFELVKDNKTYERLRNLSNDVVHTFIADYSLFSRDDFAVYVNNLKEMLHKKGIDVTFIVNIHGTSAGRAHTFPIGISQLRKTFDLEGIIPATDIYLGDYTIRNIIDIWNINEILRATTKKPFGVMEFECGNGDYGNNLGERIDPNATVHKAVISYILGNRFLNYYLFSGGVNPKLRKEVKDGNGRIAFTGEEHGFAAPIRPNGELDYTYEYVKFANEFLTSLERQLGKDFSLVYDNVLIGYLDEYYRTEYAYGIGNRKRSDIEIHRGYNFWDSFLKTLFVMGFRYKFVDLEFSKPNVDQLLILPTAKYVSKSVQENIVRFIEKGGKVIFYGDLPVFDEFGSKCTILIDYLNIKPGREFLPSPHFYLSVSSPDNLFREFRTHWAREIITKDNEKCSSSILAYVTQENAACSVFLHQMNTLFIAAHFNTNFIFFNRIFEIMGLKPHIRVLAEDKDKIGTLLFALENMKTRKKFLLAVNIDNFPKKVRIVIDDVEIGTRNVSPKEIIFEKISD